MRDSNGRLRDPKNPTIGPIELNVPGTGDTTVHRYLYDDNTPCVRETHRYLANDNTDFTCPSYAKADVTRFIGMPGGSGPLLYADDDGTVDVQMTDRDGQPWFWYRAREGRYTIPTYPKSPTVDGKLTHPLGEFPYGDLRRIPWAYRGTGMLTPLGLPWSPFPNGRPWYSYVVEQDILAGRRGVAGWDGYSYDRGLWLPPLSPAEDWTLFKFVGGVVMIVGGVIACFIPGGQGPGAGLIIGGAGMLTSGYAEASMHNPNAPWAVGYTAARVTDIVGMTLFAVGTAKALSPLAGWLTTTFPRAMLPVTLAGAGYGGYVVADTGIDIIRNWDKMNALDVAQRTVPLVAAFAGAMAGRAGFKAGQKAAERFSNIGGKRVTYDFRAGCFRNSAGQRVPFEQVKARVFASMARARGRLGYPDGAHTIARLDVGRRLSLGRNSGASKGGTRVTLKPLNAQTATHAEGEAFQRAFTAGIGEREGVLWVDRPLCRPCEKGGVGSLLRATGMDNVFVITPDGESIISAGRPSIPVAILIAPAYWENVHGTQLG